MNRMFYFKNKLFDFHLKIPFIEIKIYLNNFFSLILSILNLKNYLSAYKLYKNQHNSILIIELNNFHSEIFPSWLFYLKEISYKGNIFFLSTSSVYKEKPFDLIDNQKQYLFDFYEMDQKIILLLYKIGFFKNYKRVIFNSDGTYLGSIGISHSYFQLLELINRQNILKNSLFTSHNILKSIECIANKIILESQLITISPPIAQDVGIKYIFPLFNKNLYCDNKTIEKKFKINKAFVSCGNIKISGKDGSGLFHALSKTKLYPKTLNIIGKAPKNLVNDFSNEINFFRNRISYYEIRKIMLKSNFILFLLNDKKSYRYKYNSLSGNLPLALNFNLIPIIEENFAKRYMLDKTNAIIYKDGDLDLAIKIACKMTYEEYLSFQTSLNNLKLRLLGESSNNLKKLINHE